MPDVSDSNAGLYRSWGKSRGSALYTDDKGKHPYEKLTEEFTYLLEDEEGENVVQELQYLEKGMSIDCREVRPIPKEDDFLEVVWKSFRENQNIDI